MVRRWGTALSRLGCLVGAGALLAGNSSCGDEFDATRKAPERGSVGEELYGLVCDRVGAQALREDVTGASFRHVCHPRQDGSYDNELDLSKLPPLRGDATDAEGRPVSVDKQQENRDHHVARVEAMGKRRPDLVKAFDQSLPDIGMSLQQERLDDGTECNVTSSDTDDFLEQLADTLSRFVDLYNDQTIPELTRALGNLLLKIDEDPEIAEALARLDARQGYRPLTVALGIARPALAYPRLSELADTMLALFAADSDPHNPEYLIDPSKPTIFDNHTPVAGAAFGEFQQLLRVLREELRAPAIPNPAPLTAIDDGRGQPVLSRPRTKLELSTEILLSESDTFRVSDTPRFFAKRDPRGVAIVPLQNGFVPVPFQDDGTGRPAIDELGQFVTVDGSVAPSPFFSVEIPDSPRDQFGRAIAGSGTPVYSYVDVSRSYLSRAVADLQPHLVPAEDGGNETVLKLIQGLPLLFGDRFETEKADYPGDAARAKEYTRQGLPPPADIAERIRVPYTAFDPSTSPLVDLLHGVAATVAHPEVQHALVLLRKLLNENPAIVARLVGLGLELKAISDKYTDAVVPEHSTFWDEMIDVFTRMARDPDMLEQLVRAFADQNTFELRTTFAAFMKYKDELTYFKDPNDTENYENFNGLDSGGNPRPDGQRLLNLTTGTWGSLGTPVNRGLPDSGENRSALQKFIQLLHDVKGMSACTKAGAIVHLELDLQTIIPVPGLGNLFGPIRVDYPTDRLVTTALCGIVGAPAPDELPLCGMLRFEDVAELILDVALDQAEFDVRDPCLRNLMENQTLTGLVGGADVFLESVSGIKGFTLQPTVEGIARMGWFDTPYSTNYGTYPGDSFYPKTRDFLKDVIDPIPTQVCPQLKGPDGQAWRDSDGTVMNLRVCDRFEDTMRGRDRNALFPLGEYQFIPRIKPLAKSFADHDMNTEFVDLFDTMHLHWGSPEQTTEECDPAAPKDNARWCAQDGLVKYEEMLAEFLEASDLFPVMRDVLPLIDAMNVDICEVPAADGSCASWTSKNAIEVLADAGRVLLLPERNQGLTDARGKQSVVLNDGSENPQVTPLYLLVDALKGIDRRFAQRTAETGTDQSLRDWRDARSSLVDQFLTIEGQGNASTFQNPAMPAILDKLLEVVLSQIRANCDGPSCSWARQGFAANVAEVVRSPAFAAVFDLVEAIRQDPRARREVFRFIAYLFDDASSNEANSVSLASVGDLVQVMRDEQNMEPLYRLLSHATSPTLVDPKGEILERGTADALIEVLARIFAKDYTAGGDRLCTSAVDPNRAIPLFLERLVTPAGPNEPAPIEVILSVIADVNRADPRQAGQKFDAADYRNVSLEVSDFFLDEASGMEQVYEVVRQATLP